MALAQEADGRQAVCGVKVGRFIGSDSAAFEVPQRWTQTGPGSLSPLSFPRPTKETHQKDSLHLPQAFAQLSVQPQLLLARSLRPISVGRVALPTSSGLEELGLGWRLSLLISI